MENLVAHKPNQFCITASAFGIYPHAVERSQWDARTNGWIWSSVAVFRHVSDAQNYIIHLGLLAAKAEHPEAPPLATIIKGGPHAIIFHGFDGYDYDGHLLYVCKGVAKIRYRIGSSIADHEEFQATYLDKEHWHRIKLT